MLSACLIPWRRAQGGGVTLVVTGVLLSMSAAAVSATLHFMLTGRQALSQRLDREIAFHAAEVALLDAEADMLGAAMELARGERLDRWPAAGHCGEGPQRGLCMPATSPSPAVPAVWQPWLDRTAAAESIGVPLGSFSGAALPAMPEGVAGATTLPRYVVELLTDHATGEALPAIEGRPRLRITALGQGRDPDVRVVLQTIVQL